MTYILKRIFYEVRMWKLICRGIRDTVERNGERAITAAVENCQGNLSSVGGNKSQDQENKNNNPGGSQEERKHNSKRCAIKLHTILEAVGLSTVIWFGAFSSHPLCWRKHIHSIACNTNENTPRTPQRCRYKGLVHLIAGTASAQPLNPKNEASRLSVTVEDINDTTKEESKHSPLSPEDAFEAASRQLQATAGYIDNQLGVMSVERGHHAEAMDYFKHALLMGDVKACFNLALCYELGLGTTADPTRAVEYYEKAIHLGHATAKYNLGVYYAQGRGGLPIDYSKARQLFQDAAGEGVKEAQAALDLEQEMLDHGDNCKDIIEDSNPWQLPVLFAS